MNATVIDTLKFANHLKKAGFERRQAEGLAHALGDELAERMVTKRDLDDAVLAINTTLVTMDAKFESKFDALEPCFDAIDARFEGREPRFNAIDANFEGMETRFDAIDARFEGLEPRFDAIDARFEGLEPRFDAIDANFEALEPRFDAIDAKLESQHREFSGRFDAQHREFSGRFDAQHREFSGRFDAQQREFSSRFNVLFATMALGFTLVIGLLGYSLFSPRAPGPDAGAVAVEPQAVTIAPQPQTRD